MTPASMTLASGERLAAARRLTVKIGSALLVEPETGTLKGEWLGSLSADLARFRARGADVIIVTSGAIALGRRVLKLTKGPLKLEESQAAAAVGQIALAHAWQQSLASHGLVAGQVLLTLADTEERRRYLNARATLSTLLRHKAVPVINENDTVATTEIRYGDNDRLAARVSSMMSGDCLVLLSDVDGLYTAAPDQAGAALIPEVRDLTPEIEAMAGKPISGVGAGGMVTKIAAARIAMAAGADMVIASGRQLHPLSRILDGAPSTWFISQANPVAARKRWIAGALVPTGRIVIDAGAEMALATGKSLLPAGVKRLEGRFARGDAVSIVSEGGREIARGLVAYDRDDAQRIIGRRSAEIEAILGFRGRHEMVHRDDLVMREG
jgi:glutamate 5-kinase